MPHAFAGLVGYTPVPPSPITACLERLSQLVLSRLNRSLPRWQEDGVCEGPGMEQILLIDPNTDTCTRPLDLDALASDSSRGVVIHPYSGRECSE